MYQSVLANVAVSRSEAVNAVIYSVAQEGSALASIISAEASKLWRVLETPGVTIDQMLAANQSVQGSMGGVAELEAMLQGKLAALACEICNTGEVTE